MIEEKQKTQILLVEDNRLYQTAAKQCFESRDISAIVTVAGDYSEARQQLDHYQQQQHFSGAIIDCFFPDVARSGKRELGLEAVKKMLEKNPNSRKDTYLTRAISQVELTFGKELAKMFLKNIGKEYRQEVDHYFALEQAIKENESNQPLGILIAEKAELLGLPFVLATSTNHHDELTQPIYDFAKKKNWRLIDCSSIGSNQEKTTTAYWTTVWKALAEEFQRKK